MPDNMTILDIVAAIIMLVSIFGAARKGLVAELISLASVVIGLILSFMFYDRIGKLLVDLLVVETLALMVGFFLILFTFLIVGILVARLARQTLKFFFLRWLDRLLGSTFGILRGWLVVAILFLAMTAFPMTGSLVADSISGEFFLASARIIVQFAPPKLNERFSSEYNRIYELWLEKTRQQHHTREK